MAKPWDSQSKRILIENPQHTVDWLLPSATYVNNLSAELENETIYADLLFEVNMYNARMLLHIEIQSSHDSRMAERMWEYNMRASLKHKCSVSSVVIYLINDGAVAKTPFTKELPNGRVIHQFDFDVVKLWEIPTEYFSQQGLMGLLPFLPLTKNGARREVVDNVITQLAPPGEPPNYELLVLTYVIASLILISDAEQEWLTRRFGAMYDLLEDSYAFKELVKYSQEKALRKERERAQQEKLLELRNALFDITMELFPQLRLSARELIDTISDTQVLHIAIVKMLSFKNAEDALHYLQTIKG